MIRTWLQDNRFSIRASHNVSLNHAYAAILVLASFDVDSSSIIAWLVRILFLASGFLSLRCAEDPSTGRCCIGFR